MPEQPATASAPRVPATFPVHYVRRDGYGGSTRPLLFADAAELVNAMRKLAHITDAWIGPAAHA